MAVINRGELPASRASDQSYDSQTKKTVNSYDRVFLVTDDVGNATEDQIRAATGVAIGDPHPVNGQATCRNLTVAETDSGGTIWRYEVTARYEDATLDVTATDFEWTGETRFVTQLFNQSSSDYYGASSGETYPVENAENIIVFNTSIQKPANSFIPAQFIKAHMNKTNNAANVPLNGADQYELLVANIRVRQDQDQNFWRVFYTVKWWPREANPQTGSKGWQFDFLHLATRSREIDAGPFKYHYIDKDGNITYDKGAGTALVKLFIQSGGASDGRLSGNNGRDVIYKGPNDRYLPADLSDLFNPDTWTP